MVKSALSHMEEAADESDVLEAWISLGDNNTRRFARDDSFLKPCATICSCTQQFFLLPHSHTASGGSPDKTGNIKTSKLSGVFTEFELAVDLSKSVSSLTCAPHPLSCRLSQMAAADSESADFQAFKAMLK